MAHMNPAELPADRAHLDADDRRRLLRFELLLADGRFEEAQEVAEDLWIEAIDAHKALYQGLANALTAVCARQARQIRGARQIAQRSRAMLEPFPRRVLGMDLDVLMESVDDFVDRGDGPVLVLRQG
jgi:predicted metal-dependent hydrolase